MAEAKKNITGTIKDLTVYHTDAYAIAVANGYEGTISEWLESLHGESAYDIAVKNGFDGTEEQWLASLAEEANGIAMESAEEAETAARVATEKAEAAATSAQSASASATSAGQHKADAEAAAQSAASSANSANTALAGAIEAKAAAEKAKEDAQAIRNGINEAKEVCETKAGEAQNAAERSEKAVNTLTPLQEMLGGVSAADNGKVLQVKDGTWSAENLSGLQLIGSVNVTVSKQIDEFNNAMFYYLGEDMSLYPNGQYANNGSGIKELIYDADMLMIQVHRNYGEETPIFIGGVGKSYNVGSGGQIVGVDLYNGYYYLAEEVANAIFGEDMTAQEVDFYAYNLPRN